MSTAIEKARAAAREMEEARVEAASATVHQLPVSQNTSASVPAVPAQKFSMDSVSIGSLSVDSWIKVNEDGLKIGDSALITSLVVSLDMTDGSGFVPKRSIKAGKNPVQYFSTYDGVTAASGGSWATAIQRALAMDPSARDYPSVDLPFRLEEAAMDIKGKEVAKAGADLGHATSTTNWKNWGKLHKQVEAAGLMGERVLLKLTSEAITRNGNTWGVIAFELLGAVEGGE